MSRARITPTGDLLADLLALDLRTTDEHADAEVTEYADAREILTGLPARPSVTR